MYGLKIKVSVNLSFVSYKTYLKYGVFLKFEFFKLFVE